ncbi:MAG: DUF4859 domain-containing protein [Sporocytophaga sp.]|uniref:InlB B-repeat-containing protein n=1 Tax=Sporocytophaga sp. TaxID=2231183 RepID=UPI001B0E7122|nr:DUF4859 domain-containing protein [Sporocytophaga sp.]MBO9703606.1 DUF4859 domain-containing protein [Sporocytophaga sp.]
MKKLIIPILILLSSQLIAQTGDPYKWPAYSPNVRYNFKEQNPNFVEPTKNLNDCPQVVGEINDRWFTFRWGPNRRKDISDLAIKNLLIRMNEDFAYFRNVMGWPADKRARSGYRSAIYLYGSGLCTDNADTNATGGWQSAIGYQGQSWPMVLASYVPIRSFDPKYNDEFQKGAMVHEGIHAVLADMPGVKQSAWFQEGGNVWLQQTADARRSGNYGSMGNLNATDFMAPFMPIECYSGWLVDGSFGGPSAEGVNKYNSSNQQLCTWRRALGGHQYSSMFPTALAQILGDGSIPWIWVNCPGRVLEGLAGGIGETQMRRVITEYRAKMALMDLGEWTKASIDLLNANFGANIGVEWEPSYMQPPSWKVTPYASTTRNGNVLTPDPLTLPGWSGSNQIPLTVTGNTVTVDFQPIGTNMTCLLAYRTTTGKAVYSEFISSGNCTLKLNEAPANGVVIAVITNTDYVYKGEATRTAKFDYRLGLVTGVTGAASINTKWYESAKLRNLNTVTFTGTIVGNGGSISPEVSGYLVGDTAIITAYPKAGYAFAGWSGDIISTANPLKIVMSANKKVTATFTAGPTYKLITNIVGAGTVNLATGDYSQGSIQTLTAKPATGYIFTGWSGDATGTTNPLTITMLANKTITATFTAIPVQTITYNVELVPNTNYTPTNVPLNSTQMGQIFGLTAAQITSGFTNKTIKYFGVNSDGTLDSVSTANAPGHWFNKSGEITEYGDQPYVYSELNMSKLIANVGHYPGKVRYGESYTFRQALVYTKSATDVKQITLVFNVSITSVITGLDEANGEIKGTIYPNPSNESFKVELIRPSDIAVYSLDGQKLMEYKNAESVVFGEQLKAGIYIVKTGNLFYKIVKE